VNMFGAPANSPGLAVALDGPVDTDQDRKSILCKTFQIIKLNKYIVYILFD